MKGLKGKVAVVTGATSGIGLATALAFAREGVNVVLAGRRADKGREIQQEAEKLGVKSVFEQTDVSKEEDVKKLFKRVEKEFGHLDFAFNNAGVEGELGSITEAQEANYNKIMDTNLKGVVLSMKYEIPLMKKAGAGSIVNTGSIASLIGMANFSLYVASKHAVLGLTKAVALEVATDKIRVNAVSPAAIETDMFNRFIDNDEEKKLAFAKVHPMNRIGTVKEIADAVLFLCSDYSTFTTGQSLTIDGGYTAA